MSPQLASTKADRARLATGETHDYQPPGEGASRSVCPALNAMANHGYIQRDGKNISMLEMYRGLKACYGLSSALAAILVVGGWVLFKRFGRIKLFDIGLHNGIEHDASVVHLDCPAGQKYAPIEIQQDLVNDFAMHVMKAASAAAGRKLAEAEVVVTEHDMILTRIRREKLSPPLGSLHADLGRGELAAILGIWNKTVDGKQGVPLTWIRTWLATERLPDGWSPDHVETLRAVMKGMSAMKAEMKKIRDEEAAAAGS
ncbi:Chloroperoxidase [Mycena olivaceomarginata]|nr:Chloroperoxidase [Mycena olivaceomarginata]